MTLPLPWDFRSEPPDGDKLQDVLDVIAMNAGSGSGGGGAPSGPAGGVLSGTYPNPGFAQDMATQAELDAHTSLTTTAHGGIVASTDARLFNARTPTAHASSHHSGGTDPLVLGSIAGSLTKAQSPLTTKGDLLATDGTSLQRVGVGSDGQVLTADSTQTGGVKWAGGAGQAPQVRAFHNAAQSVAASGVVSTLLFNSERYDLGTGTEQHSTSTNTSRLTCQQAGLYSINGLVSWAANATGYRQVFIQLNGTTNIAFNTVQAVSVASVGTNHAVACDYRLAVGDYVELCVNQNSGSAVNIVSSANSSPEFMMHWVST